MFFALGRIKQMRNILIPIFFITILLAVPAPAYNSEPILRVGVFPTYPSCALERRVQGRVRVKAVLDSSGNVVQAIPIYQDKTEIRFPELKDNTQFAFQCLVLAAQNAASHWKFKIDSKVQEVVLVFDFELVDNSGLVDDLYPVYVAPYEITIRGLSMPIIINSSW
jgi:hypothetical protein